MLNFYYTKNDYPKVLARLQHFKPLPDSCLDYRAGSCTLSLIRPLRLRAH